MSNVVPDTNDVAEFYARFVADIGGGPGCAAALTRTTFTLAPD